MRCADGAWSAQDALHQMGTMGRHGVLARMMEGLAERQAACKCEGKGPPLAVLHERGTGQRRHWRCCPAAEALIADRGCDAERFRDVLKDKGIGPSFPGRKSRGKSVRLHKPMKVAQPDRDHVRPPEGLAPHRDPLRQMPGDCPARRRSCCNCRGQAVTVNESGAELYPWLLTRNSADRYPPPAASPLAA